MPAGMNLTYLDEVHEQERRDEAISGVPLRRLLRCARNDPVANPRCANLVWSDLGSFSRRTPDVGRDERMCWRECHTDAR